MNVNQQHTQDFDKANLDGVLAGELNKLSLNDRTQVQEELHCCSSMAIKETPCLVERSISEFSQKTMKLVSSGDLGSKEFQQLFAFNLGFLHCSAVCLKYLRVDFFKIESAAKRMVTHFELLFRHFGPIALQRPLRLSDLDKEEQNALKAGSVQFLPCRDKAGRLIIVHQGSIEGTTDYQRVSEPSMETEYWTQNISWPLFSCSVESDALLSLCHGRRLGYPETWACDYLCCQ